MHSNMAESQKHAEMKEANKVRTIRFHLYETLKKTSIVTEGKSLAPLG